MNSGNDAIDETANKQGWNTETLLGLVIEFLGSRKHASVLEELEEHLRFIASEENGECEDEDEDRDLDGPFQKERAAASAALERGSNEIVYRGRTFNVLDHLHKWTYFYGGSEFGSMEEVFEVIDKELDLPKELCHVCHEPFDERRRCACEVEDKS